MVVKINFHGGKNQFFSPVSGTNIRAGYACKGNAHIGLAGIRGKTSFGGQLYLENCARTLRNCPAAHQNNFYRECQPIQWERYPCTRSQRGYLRLTQEKKIDFYHRGNWFLPPWKWIITTGEIDFYHHGNWLLPQGKLIFTTIEKKMFGFIWLHYHNHPQQ